MGASFGVAARGRDGETVFNKVGDLEVPAVVRNSVKRAAEAASLLKDPAVKATKWGLGKAVSAAKEEVANLKGELTQFGVLDLSANLKDDEKSAVIDFLRGMARRKADTMEMSDTPEIKGNSSYGASTSNGNINAAIKFLGGSAFLPTNGSTGVYLYLNDETNEVSGFMATIKWKLP